VLDKRLGGRAFVATEEEPSIADFAIIGWAWRHERHRVDLADFPEVRRWYETMMARPGARRGFEAKLA
jgi:GST-like protein